MELPIEKSAIADILSHFPVVPEELTSFIDSSRGDGDTRWNFLFGASYVLKINTPNGMWEARLQEISRLICRYRAIGVYCPAYIPTVDGPLSCAWEHAGKTYTCFVEEFARYPTFRWEMPCERKMLVAHLGALAAKYTDVDLSPIHSMWSIIDLSPFDTDVDEKQENADALTAVLRDAGCTALAERVDALNRQLRAAILPGFRALPRCVFQGDLNSSNALQDHGRFVGLIDFNCSGTDVNINVFINETNWFPGDKDLDTLSIPEILEKMDRIHIEDSAPIYQHYRLNDLERQMYPCFRRIVDLFQYPNVCSMAGWLRTDARREACIRLIEALVEKPL